MLAKGAPVMFSGENSRIAKTLQNHAGKSIKLCIYASLQPTHSAGPCARADKLLISLKIFEVTRVKATVSRFQLPSIVRKIPSRFGDRRTRRRQARVNGGYEVTQVRRAKLDHAR